MKLMLPANVEIYKNKDGGQYEFPVCPRSK